MIARIWHGRVPESKAEAYVEFLKTTGLPDYANTPGNLGVYVLRRTQADHADFLLISLWESWESIRPFAGPDVSKAVYYSEDREFLLELEPTVAHYDVLSSPSTEPRKG